MKLPAQRSQLGFTLVEIVTVLVLLGILSAVAFSRLGNVDSYTQSIYTQQLLSYLRLTQRTAVAHQGSGASLSITRTTSAPRAGCRPARCPSRSGASAAPAGPRPSPCRTRRRGGCASPWAGGTGRAAPGAPRRRRRACRRHGWHRCSRSACRCKSWSRSNRRATPSGSARPR